MFPAEGRERVLPESRLRMWTLGLIPAAERRKPYNSSLQHVHLCLYLLNHPHSRPSFYMHSIHPASRYITLSPSHLLHHHTMLLSAYIHLCLYLLDPPLSRPSFYMHSILQSLVLSLFLHLAPSIPLSSSLLISTSVCIFLILLTHVLLSICTLFFQTLVLSLSPSLSLHHAILLSAYIHLCQYLLHPQHSSPSFYVHSIPLDSRYITLSTSHSLHHTILSQCLYPSLSISSSSSTLTSFFLCALYSSRLSLYHSFYISLPPSQHPHLCLYPLLPISSRSSTLTSLFLLCTLFLQYLCLFPPPPPMSSWSFTLTSFFLGTGNKDFRNIFILLNNYWQGHSDK